MAQRWIYRYEVKGIQPYILATDKLREMQGASSLIEAIGELFGEARSAFGLQGARLLSMPTAGGGSLEVEDGQRSRIETLMSAWPLLVSRHAPGLQVVQAMVPQGEGAWDALHDELRRDRSRVDPELPEAGPMVLRAPRTGLPACGRKDTYVDPAGLRKLEAAAEDRLAKRLGRGGWLEDLDRIGHPYVGVVHLDGNDMGQHLRRLGHGDLLAFSEGLERATLATVQAAVEETLREPGDSVTLPARPIVVGGDDVTFIVRGDLALPFAAALLRVFERQTGALCKELPALGCQHLTAAAGVALVHKRHPFHAAYDLAEGLCKHAKRALRGKASPTPSGLSFHRLTTSLAGTFDDILDQELRADSTEGGKRRAARDREDLLTLCPYTLQPVDDRATLESLERLVEAARGLPRGALREWAGLMRESGERARQHFQRIQQVQKDKDRERFAEFEAALGAMGAGGGWRKVGAPGPDGRAPQASPIPDVLTWQSLAPAGSKTARRNA